MRFTVTSMTIGTAWGRGILTRHADGTVLAVHYLQVGTGPEPDDPVLLELPTTAATAELDALRRVQREVVLTQVELTSPPLDTADAYLRLHLLSTRTLPPHSLNLSGIFGLLPTVVWTDLGPCAVSDFTDVTAESQLLLGRRPVVVSMDKFPRLVDFVHLADVRIADAQRVRLGAYLSPGTTVMHEGFVNFNAGTLGACMVEGRISAGVVVGAGSDIGGGASIMGTLSGGGEQVVSIGERTLLGANSGIGISLGDDCVVEAGLYVTAGTKVALVSPDAGAATTVKARELSGRSNLLLRRNSLTGQVEAVTRNGAGVQLNQDLH